MNSMYPWPNHLQCTLPFYKMRTLAVMSSEALFTFNLLNPRCNFSPYVDLYACHMGIFFFYFPHIYLPWNNKFCINILKSSSGKRSDSSGELSLWRCPASIPPPWQHLGFFRGEVFVYNWGEISPSVYRLPQYKSLRGNWKFLLPDSPLINQYIHRMDMWPIKFSPSVLWICRTTQEQEKQLEFIHSRIDTQARLLSNSCYKAFYCFILKFSLRFYKRPCILPINSFFYLS